ncbi:hypothetical protein F5Y03DRAFT_382921 [Xylaria venustula]|nr:hypothetical protein F5Y03DRAFT_382921 [Xylaria venustula]
MVPSVRLLSYAGGILSLYLPTPIFGLALKSEEKLLSARQSPYGTRILDTGSTFGQEDNGVWQLIDATADGIPDLAYIKTKSTGTDSVEVHIASSSSGFQTRIVETGTTFAEESDGTWLLVPSTNSALPDLAFIKTSNTPSGKVEVHIASGASQYKTRTQETATAFANEDNGFWSLYDYDGDGILDLVYIKTRNTRSRKVEVYIASGASSYSQIILQAVTTFAPDNNGFWLLAPFSGPGEADLAFIKDANTATGRIEIYAASKSSGYRARIFQGASGAFAEEANGIWSLIDYNGNGVLDLTYIKYVSTGTGTTEVHVAAG